MLLSLKSVKRPAIRLIRSKFSVVTQHLSDSELRRAFRMTRSSFMLLLSRLNHHLVRDRYQGTRSSGGVVESNVRLVITLRLFAGGSYHDQMMCWGVVWYCIFEIFLETLAAVMFEVKMSGIPLDDQDALKELAHGFKYSRNRTNPLYGCIGALDGIAIAISKLPNEYVPRNFFVENECMRF